MSRGAPRDRRAATAVGRRDPRRLALVLALAAPLLAAPAAAQSGAPDVPPGPAAVSGRLVHDTRPEAAAGVDVLLYALTADGGAGLRQTRSDAEGRFRFEGVSNDPGVVYLLGARPGDVPFGRRFAFAEGELEHSLELALSDPETDASGVLAAGIDLRVDRGCTHLRVSHSHELRNPSERVVFVPASERAAAAPLLEVEIPAGAEGFESLLGGEGLERDGARVRFWGPLRPGSQEIVFGYGLPLDAGALAVGLPGGAGSLRVLVPEGVLAVSGDGLRPGETTEVGAQRYAGLERGAVAPGETLELDLALAPAPDAALATSRAELWLELDDAALEVSERLEVAAPDGAALAESPAVPLLCFPLPPEVESLRFSPETLEAGLRRDPSGALAIHGPLPAGATPLALTYRLPASSDGGHFERRFDRPLPLLSVLVADTGVIAETGRLHRRRSVRSAERMYLHLEAFAVAPDETITLDLRRTAPRGGNGPWAAAGFAVLAGLASLGFLAGPLRADAPAADDSADRDPLRLEQHAIDRSLDALDEDLETGKLSADDHAAMRSELEAHAAKLRVRAAAAPAETAAAAAPAAAGACGACGAASRPGDQFCARCGARLAAGARPA